MKLKNSKNNINKIEEKVTTSIKMLRLKERFIEEVENELTALKNNKSNLKEVIERLENRYKDYKSEYNKIEVESRSTNDNDSTHDDYDLYWEWRNNNYPD